MAAQDVHDFGLAHQNSVRVGEKEKFRNTLDAGIITDIVDLFLENRQNNYERAVLYLTSVNDATTLKSVLEWARNNEIKLIWDDYNDNDKEKDKDIRESRVRKNPLMISVQQGYTQCTELLYRHGYRIPMLNVDGKTEQDCSKEEWDCVDKGTINKDPAKRTEAQKEVVRKKRIEKKPGDEDQVERLLEFRAYTRPEYLSFIFTDNVRSEDIRDIKEEAITEFQKLDPLRRALDMAEEAENFSSEFQEITELKKHYAEVKEKLEDFACGILTQCSTMDNVDTLLKHNPKDNDDDEDDPEERNWQKALAEGRKAFVSHPFYQQFFIKQLYGKYGYDHRTNRLRWNLYHVPLALAVFCLYPLIVFVDLFREANILFVTAETMKKRGKERTKKQGENYKTDTARLKSDDIELNDNDNIFEQKSDKLSCTQTENMIFLNFRIWVHTPIFRMISYHTSQLTYLSLLLIAVWNPHETPKNTTNHWYFYIVVVFIFSLLLEDFVDVFRKKRYWKSFWNRFSLATRFILVIGGGLSFHWHHWRSEQIQTSTEERANQTGNHQLNIGMTLVSVAIGLEIFHTLQFLLLGEYLGPIVTCVVKVFKDVARVFIIFFIIFVAHAVCAWSMFKPFQAGSRNTTARYQLVEENLKSKQGLFDGMLWRVLNPEGPGMVEINDTTKGDEPFSLEFSHLMGIIMWAVYQTIMAILLVNILIAIMNSTYIKVWESSNTEWKYSKTYYQAQFLLPRSIFPSPFRWIYYSAKFVYKFKLQRKAEKGLLGSAWNLLLKGSETPKTQQDQIVKQKGLYFKLLRKLIRVKQLSTEENHEGNLHQFNMKLQMKVKELQKKIEGLQKTVRTEKPE